MKVNHCRMSMCFTYKILQWYLLKNFLRVVFWSWSLKWDIHTSTQSQMRIFQLNRVTCISWKRLGSVTLNKNRNISRGTSFKWQFLSIRAWINFPRWNPTLCRFRRSCVSNVNPCERQFAISRTRVQCQMHDENTKTVFSDRAVLTCVHGRTYRPQVTVFTYGFTSRKDQRDRCEDIRVYIYTCVYRKFAECSCLSVIRDRIFKYSTPFKRFHIICHCIIFSVSSSRQALQEGASIKRQIMFESHDTSWHWN